MVPDSSVLSLSPRQRRPGQLFYAEVVDTAPTHPQREVRPRLWRRQAQRLAPAPRVQADHAGALPPPRGADAGPEPPVDSDREFTRRWSGFEDGVDFVRF